MQHPAASRRRPPIRNRPPSQRPPSRGVSRRGLLAWAIAGGALTIGGGAVARLIAFGRASDRVAIAGVPTGPTSTAGAASGAAPAPAATAAPTAGALNLTAEQKVGQLFMVGLSSGASSAELAQVKDAIGSHHAGNIVLFGAGWNSAESVRAAVTRLQTLARQANAGIGLFVSGNQEGGDQGTFQAFYGSGFSSIPRPIDQAQSTAAQIEGQASTWGAELLNAGVNLNLAPVLDTVPRENAAANDPIGHWGREYGYDPDTVIAHGLAFEQGMSDAGVAVAIKHFPGLGRVTGNTDYTATGIVDNVFSGAGDPYLAPFKAGIDAGADFVMIALARYPQVDATQPAVFSPIIIDQLLRQSLGFQKVVITDDVGAAAAVADRSPTARAIGFLQAGGDMVLTVAPSDIAVMTQAVLQQMSADTTFAARVETSVNRVLAAKDRRRLLPAAP